MQESDLQAVQRDQALGLATGACSTVRVPLLRNRESGLLLLSMQRGSPTPAAAVVLSPRVQAPQSSSEHDCLARPKVARAHEAVRLRHHAVRVRVR